MSGAEADKFEEEYVPALGTVKVMLKDYFEQHHGEAVDRVDLVNAFDIPLPLIVMACEELEREGRIAGVD